VADNSRAINRVFTRNVLTDLIERGSNEVFDVVVKRYINDPEIKTHGKIISEIYAHLCKEHRNVYYYMNTLLNKLLVSIHSVNSTTALSQVRICGHIADFVMINGEGRVYEIKSDLDNYARLYDQLSDFYKAFSKISVLSTIHEYNRVEKVLSECGDLGRATGIYVMNDDDIYFSQNNRRQPQEFDEYLDHSCIFKLLRKREYENIVLQVFGELPRVAPVFHFRACSELFKRIPIKEAQERALVELKKRNKISKTVFERIQPELRSTVYFAGLSGKLPQLEEFLQSNFRG
jgi:hypothetical protein